MMHSSGLWMDRSAHLTIYGGAELGILVITMMIHSFLSPSAAYSYQVRRVCIGWYVWGLEVNNADHLCSNRDGDINERINDGIVLHE